MEEQFKPDAHETKYESKHAHLHSIGIDHSLKRCDEELYAYEYYHCHRSKFREYFYLLELASLLLVLTEFCIYHECLYGYIYVYDDIDAQDDEKYGRSHKS